MMKYFLIIVFLLAGNYASAQFSVSVEWEAVSPVNSGDTIYYNSDRKLTWPDFKGKPNAASPAAAITESGFGYKMSMNSIGNRTTVVIKVFCYFNKNHSWVKRGMNSDYALLHEQHHFDITFINACLFVKKVRKAALNKNNFNSLVDKIHDECFAAMDKMQDEYDGQTSNGRLKNIQAIWNKKIDSQLATLTTD